MMNSTQSHSRLFDAAFDAANTIFKRGAAFLQENSTLPKIQSVRFADFLQEQIKAAEAAEAEEALRKAAQNEGDNWLVVEDALLAKVEEAAAIKIQAWRRGMAVRASIDEYKSWTALVAKFEQELLIIEKKVELLD